MRGPSSSHTAGAFRIGLMAQRLFGRPIKRVVVQFSSKGSLPTTYVSQGSEIGLIAGLMGVSLEDDGIINIVDKAKSIGLIMETVVDDEPCNHPNIYNLTLFDRYDNSLKVVGVSMGGGMVKIINVGGVETDFEGDTTVTIEGVGTLEPILPIRYDESSIVPFNNAREFVQLPLDKPIYEYALDYEAARGGMSREEVWAVAKRVMSVMRRSLETGLAGTQFKDRILGQQFHLIDKAIESKRLIHSPLTNRIEKYVLAIMECKSSFGLLVAAPTAGSCAVIPATILACCDELGYDDDLATKALLGAGLIGMFIAKDSTFSAEVAGCQAECGSASGMAAAAVVQLQGGSAKESCQAASFALQNVLGMVCDPIANRVEAPCLGKNIMCAVNALSAGNVALAGVDTLIPLDEVIHTLDFVGKAIIHELRCTSLGGLSVCKTSLEIEKRLAEQ